MRSDAHEIRAILDQLEAMRPVIDPSDPMATAEMFRDTHFQAGGDFTLFHWRGAFYAWKATAYRPVPDDELRCMIWRYLSGSLRRGKDELTAVKPTPAMVDATLDALGAVAELPGGAETQSWIGGPPEGAPRGGLTAVANGLLHLDSGVLHPANPRFFNTSASPVAYDPAASAAGWTEFLGEVFCDDAESVSLLQEWFGYVLSGRTDLQKILLLIGPPRSGKSTIARIVTALLGPDAVTGPSLASFANPFGLQGLLDKPLAVIAEARLGSRVDQHQIVERLLSISGEDFLSIPRKYAIDWTGRLPTRLMILSNELPRLGDASSALTRRFLVLQMTKSFLGREDTRLAGRLLAALPGILRWSVEGLGLLKARGRFVQPKSGEELLAELVELTSPIAQFIAERCLLGEHREVSCADLFTEWGLWKSGQGWESAGTMASFGRDLRAAIPRLKVIRPGSSGGRARVYRGIALAKQSSFGVVAGGRP